MKWLLMLLLTAALAGTCVAGSKKRSPRSYTPGYGYDRYDYQYEPRPERYRQPDYYYYYWYRY